MLEARITQQQAVMAWWVSWASGTPTERGDMSSTTGRMTHYYYHTAAAAEAATATTPTTATTVRLTKGKKAKKNDDVEEEGGRVDLRTSVQGGVVREPM